MGNQISKTLPTFTIPDAPDWRNNLSGCLDNVQPGDTISCATLEQYEVTQERIRSLRLGGSILFVRPDGTEWTEAQAVAIPVTPENALPDGRELFIEIPDQPYNRERELHIPLSGHDFFQKHASPARPLHDEPVELSTGKEVVIAGMRFYIESIELDFDAVNYLNPPTPGASMTLHLKPVPHLSKREQYLTRVRSALDSGQYDYGYDYGHVPSPACRWDRATPHRTYFSNERIYIVADSTERAKEFCDLAGIPSSQWIEIILCGEDASRPYLGRGATVPYSYATVFYDSSARNASNEFRHYLGTCRIASPPWVGCDYNRPPSEDPAEMRRRQHEGMLNLASELDKVARLTIDRWICGNSLRSAELLRTHVQIAHESARIQRLSIRERNLIRSFAEGGIAPALGGRIPRKKLLGE